MFSTITSGTVCGISSHLVQVEVDLSKGLPCFQMVGLLSSEVREARERVRVALKNAGISLPPVCINVNLSPADVRKEGTMFDLPVAVGILMSLGHLKREAAVGTVLLGELGLNGEIKPVRGVLPMVLQAQKDGITEIYVPIQNAKEGAVVQGIRVFGVEHISQLLAHLQGEASLHPQPPTPKEITDDKNPQE